MKFFIYFHGIYHVIYLLYKRKMNNHVFLHFIVEFLRVNMSWEDFLAKINYDPVNAGSFWDLRICRDKKENRF